MSPVYSLVQKRLTIYIKMKILHTTAEKPNTISYQSLLHLKWQGETLRVGQWRGPQVGAPSTGTPPSL